MNKIVNLMILIVASNHLCLSAVFEAVTDDSCEFKLNNSFVYLSINETWLNPYDRCQTYVCKENIDDDPKVVIMQQSCNVTCEVGFIYKFPQNECCGQCVSLFCKFEGKLYNPNDIWKSPDNCNVNECVDTGNGYVVNSYKKNCPKLKNCPAEFLETKNCCPFCNTRNERNLRPGNEVEVTSRDTYASHPCSRDCVKGETLTCYYEFIVEAFETMSKACYDCPQNETDCFRPHCVQGDGMKRSIVVVNRMMPGPTIEVCLNDTIIVDVKNHLMSEGTTIHWHGMHQRKTPYMDGVPHISQCPIGPGQTFRYNFNAKNQGTHFWHSHIGMQRGDGVYGALIVKMDSDPQESLYDFDMSEHLVLTNDWTHMPASSVFTSHYHGRGDNKPGSILINGRGKYHGKMTTPEPIEDLKLSNKVEETILNNLDEKNAQLNKSEDEIITTSIAPEIPTTLTIVDNYEESTLNYNVSHSEDHLERKKRQLFPPSDDSVLVPLTVFNVVQGNRYRFRHINAGFMNCPIEISIDNHTLTAIASDGNNIKPVEATFLVTYAGERWDFVINANQAIGNYYIRFRGLMDCDERFTSAFQMAILHYQGSPYENPQNITPGYNLTREGMQINALNRGSGMNDSITMAELHSMEANKSELITKQDADYKFYISYDFYPKDNPLFHVPDLYGFEQVPANRGRVYTPQLNHISLKMPTVPMMIGKGLLESTFCNESSLIQQGVNCKETFCECTHVLQVPLNAVVEMILIDEGVTYDANHMFHLHGNFFHVVGMDRVARNVTKMEIKEMDRLGKLNRKLGNSPQKDTVTVPDGGYTIVRFYADNPGYWLMHCHIEFHAELGMALILKVGDNHEMPPVPKNFPTCFDYMASGPEEIKKSSGTSIHLHIIVTTTLFVAHLL